MKRRSEVTNPESADLGLWKQKPPLLGVPFHLATLGYYLSTTHQWDSYRKKNLKKFKKIRLWLPRVAGELCHIFFQQDWVLRNMFINMVLILMIMHLAWKVVGENWG